MLRPPSAKDLRAIAYYTGFVVTCFGLLMFLPIMIGLMQREWKPALDFATGMGISLTTGFGLQLFWRGGGRPEINWRAGLVAALVSWLVCLLLGAVPYSLTGYYRSFLDALFDTMSGLTTTGLTLVQDLNHLPDSLNTWRMLLSWLGGQGVVLLSLLFFARGIAGTSTLYIGEGKGERLLSGFQQAGRMVWLVSLAYLIPGTLMAWLAALSAGLAPGRALLHGLWLFLSAFSTGGFAPYGQNLLFYHSFAVELVVLIFFVVGSINVKLHWSLFTGDRQEIRKNLEVITFAITAISLVALATYELGRLGVYSNLAGLVRKGLWQVLSAHTTAGFTTLYTRQLIQEWGPAAMVAILTAMVLGGSAGSTAGGIKAVRTGIALRGLVDDVKRLLLPESAITVRRFHLFRSVELEDRMVRSAMTMILLYLAQLGIMALLGALAGYDFLSSLFEAASVTFNVGLSAGLTATAMPWFLKVGYILGMWLGRLEFMSVFALVGYAYAGVKSR